jgi:hypothetical protein
MAGTYGELKSRIRVELWNRTDLDDQIELAISRAIEHYASKRFWFNVGRKTGASVLENQYADVPAGLRQADAVYVTIGAQECELCRSPLEEIEDLNGPTQTSGHPSYYADFGAQIRLYPIPNEVYTLTWLGLIDLDTLANDDDSNAWTDQAQDLIAARAGWFINTRILQDAEAAAACQAEEAQAWVRLQRDTALRSGDGVVEQH